jgi:aminobenzoyl-glutamate transport protein
MNTNQGDIQIRKNKREMHLHPATFFFLMSFAIIIISGIGSMLGIQATYTTINSVTGELEPTLETFHTLMNREGIRYIFGNAIRHFITFSPLVTTMVFFIGFGVMIKSGLLKDLVIKISARLNHFTITFLLFLTGILLTVITDAAYIVMIPLGALFFLYNRRHPLVGIIAAFASVSLGYTLNIFVSNIDLSLINYANAAAKIIDPHYTINYGADLFIMLVGIILMSWVGTYITERFIVRKIGKYKIEATTETESLQTPNKRKGFIICSITLFFWFLFLGYAITPGLKFSGLLLDYTGSDYLTQLFGFNSYWQQGIVIITTVTFFIAGISYGGGSGKFKNNNDVIDSMMSYMTIISSIIVMSFFASQFIALFRQTNIGMVIAAWSTEIIKALNFTGLPLIIIVIIFITLINLFVPSATLKWSILSPIMVPTLMQLNLTPEFTLAIFKVGDSLTNGLTPLLPYFVIFIVFLNYYNPNKQKPIGITKAISLMFPYVITYFILWILIFIGWYIIGLPIGPGIYPTI